MTLSKADILLISIFNFLLTCLSNIFPTWKMQRQGLALGKYLVMIVRSLISLSVNIDSDIEKSFCFERNSKMGNNILSVSFIVKKYEIISDWPLPFITIRKNNFQDLLL